MLATLVLGRKLARQLGGEHGTRARCSTDVPACGAELLQVAVYAPHVLARRSPGLASIFLALVVTTSARAYVRTRPPGSAHSARLRSADITLWIDPKHLPEDISSDRFLAAAQASAKTWSTPAVACTSIRISVQVSDQELTGGKRDKHNSLVFQTQRWCRGGSDRSGNCYDHRAASFTTVHFGTTVEPYADVAIDEADIELNAVDFEWSGSGPRTSDLHWFITHEIGHVLGLEHICATRNRVRPLRDDRGAPVPACQEPLPRAIMAPAPSALTTNAGKIRALDPDARRAVCEIYPRAHVEQAHVRNGDTWLYAIAALLGVTALARYLRAKRAPPNRPIT